MTSPPPTDSAGAETRLVAALHALPAGAPLPDLSGVDPATLERALRAVVARQGAEAAPLVARLAEEAPDKGQRKTARRALYRLGQSGLPPPTAPRRPLVRREAPRPVAAWLSSIDGAGSRAAWIAFEGGIGGGLSLCSLIVNDQVGILEVAGGSVTRRRLERELQALRDSQKLPWVEAAPAHACAIVREALELHASAGTRPPATFDRWGSFFAAAPAGAPAPLRAEEADPLLVERADTLLDLPEMAGWFVDPAEVQADALRLLEARDSRLVVSDQVKAEREAAIMDAALARSLTPALRDLWARRLEEMALVFVATARQEPAALARAAAAALRNPTRAAERLPFVRAMVRRGLEMAGEVALGRARLEDVTRTPGRSGRA